MATQSTFEQSTKQLTESPLRQKQHEDAQPNFQRGKSYTFALSPDAIAELRIDGALTTEDLDVLRDYIEITIKALSKVSSKPKSPTPGETD